MNGKITGKSVACAMNQHRKCVVGCDCDCHPKAPPGDEGGRRADAYTLGAMHAEAGEVWDTATESDHLMDALGERGETTLANADRRGRLCDAYNDGIASVMDPEARQGGAPA